MIPSRCTLTPYPNHTNTNPNPLQVNYKQMGKRFIYATVTDVTVEGDAMVVEFNEDSLEGISYDIADRRDTGHVKHKRKKTDPNGRSMRPRTRKQRHRPVSVFAGCWHGVVEGGACTGSNVHLTLFTATCCVRTHLLLRRRLRRRHLLNRFSKKVSSQT